VLPEPAPLPPLAELERRLEAHPSQQEHRRRILAGQSELDFVREARKPDWMLDLSYGLRSGREEGMARSNMLSAMVTVGLPRLRSGRIDAEIAAASADLRSLHEMHEDHQRELAAELERSWTELQRIDDLLRVYDEELLPLAAQALEAALLALRHARGGVEDTVTAQQLVLETRLKHARLLADRALARHDVDYLTGESP
jgi:outer membrane protein TolC